MLKQAKGLVVCEEQAASPFALSWFFNLKKCLEVQRTMKAAQAAYDEGQAVLEHLNAQYLKVYNEQKPSENIRDAFTDSYGIIHPQPVMIS